MKKLSKKEIDYWLFSNSSTATFFRCRNEIALEEIRGVTNEEAKDIGFKIRKALERGKRFVLICTGRPMGYMFHAKTDEQPLVRF